MVLRILIVVPVCVVLGACTREVEVGREAELPTPAVLESQCEQEIGPPRVVEVATNLYVAIGYDLANTILLHTPDGNVVVDVSMSPARARKVKEDLLAEAPGPIRAIVYTHSHIDHVGGASVWVEEGTEIWATEAFRDHLVKQYGLFQPTEARRGARQFGRHVSEEDVPCIGLGPRLDFESASRSGIRFPTRTFRGETSFEVGGVAIELVEAHGETHDQLFVWIPSLEALLPGDNFYSAFPNVYTIRGTSPRPVDDWVRSIDEMRRRQPKILVPSHTRPRTGRDTIETELRDYRDGIQWIRDEVVRGANRGVPLEEMVRRVGLPPHLAEVRNLAQLYGQIDWSVKAIYGNQLGWFDGAAEALYPDPEAPGKEIDLMGGAEAVFREAKAARERGELRFAVQLLGKLRDAGSFPEARAPELREERMAALRELAGTITNTNGRAYLLEVAHELEHGFDPLPSPRPDDSFLEGIPLRSFFRIMASRLVPERSLETHEAVEFVFPKSERRFVMTIRHGVAELAEGDPLPGTPEPLARVEADGLTWRRLALGLEGAATAAATGRLNVSGSWLGFIQFMNRFQREFDPE